VELLGGLASFLRAAAFLAQPVFSYRASSSIEKIDSGWIENETARALPVKSSLIE
jgi:hypothetical protein